MISKKQISVIQLMAGGGLVLLGSLLPADPLRFGLGLWFGALWLGLAWRLGLSTLLVGGLVFLGLRMPGLRTLGLSWMLAVNMGLSAWTLTIWWPGKWRSLLAALLWVGMFLVVPSLLLLMLAGLPRMGKMQQPDANWFFPPALFAGTAAFAWCFYQGAFDGFLIRASDADTYLAIRDAYLTLLGAGSLWILIPLVGLFEISQKQAEDLRISWRNLVLFGALISLIWLPVATGVQLVYLLGLPLSAVMLSRWCLALPDIYSRAVYGLLLFGMGLSFLSGGLI